MKANHYIRLACRAAPPMRRGSPAEHFGCQALMKPQQEQLFILGEKRVRKLIFHPAPADSSSEDENGSSHDLDLGAFELVDSGMTAETLLSTEEPVIFHQ
ncbi:hypothetical protein ANCDUO_24186, partial [Ancylostoma duodenale]